MSGSFGITYKQVLPKVFLLAGPSATKHGPNINDEGDMVMTDVAHKQLRYFPLTP